MLFNTQLYQHKKLFADHALPWEPLIYLEAYFNKLELGKIEIDLPNSVHIENRHLISIGKGTLVSPGAYIVGPCYIGRDCRIGHASFIRPYTLLGDRCVVGHSSEVKHSIFLDDAKAPHFNYVGDSILGNRVNLGAGVKCANVRIDHKSVYVLWEGKRMNTGMKKLGALIGDDAQLGCNCVTNPGAILPSRFLCRPCENVTGMK